MSNKPNPSNVKTAGFSNADPLVEAGERLEIMRKRLTDDMQSKKIEFERFKEETLWRLNALSDRTIDIAREKENDVEERLARDREETDSEFALWKTRLHERLGDEGFLDALAKDAFDRLLFIEGSIEGSIEGAFGDSAANDTRRNRGDSA